MQYNLLLQKLHEVRRKGMKKRQAHPYEFCEAGRSRHWEGWSRRSRRNRAATTRIPDAEAADHKAKIEKGLPGKAALEVIAVSRR